MAHSLLLASFLKRAAFLGLVPLLLSCEDSLDKLYPVTQPVQLPAVSQAGVNTFGCLVNGQVWQANNTSTLAGKVITPTIQYRHGELRIDAFRRLQVDGPISNFHFTATHVTGPGVYELSQVQPGNTALLKTTRGQMEYLADARHPGTLTITRLDTAGAHPFVAGLFQLRAVPAPGKARAADLPAQLQVTEGRFDIQLNRR